MAAMLPALIHSPAGPMDYERAVVDTTGEPPEAEDRKIGHRLRARDYQDAYGLALLMLVSVMILPVLLPDTGVGAVVVGGMACAAALIALHSSRVRPWLFRTATGAVVISVLSLAVDQVNSSDEMRAGYYLGVGFLLLVTPIAILIRIAHHRVITPRTLYGVLSVYLLLGISFSFIYQSIDHFSPAAFAGIEDVDRVTFSYFSFITMTTVGYGDITPSSDTARMLAVFEAVMGQVFLVVIVARVVSLLGHERAPVTHEVLQRFHRAELGEKGAADLEDGDPDAIERALEVRDAAIEADDGPDADPPPP
jgi:hypothetical protein